MAVQIHVTIFAARPISGRKQACSNPKESKLEHHIDVFLWGRLLHLAVRYLASQGSNNAGVCDREKALRFGD